VIRVRVAGDTVCRGFGTACARVARAAGAVPWDWAGVEPPGGPLFPEPAASIITKTKIHPTLLMESWRILRQPPSMPVAFAHPGAPAL
jgi:hypothetical protein